MAKQSKITLEGDGWRLEAQNLEALRDAQKSMLSDFRGLWNQNECKRRARLDARLATCESEDKTEIRRLQWWLNAKEDALRERLDRERKRQFEERQRELIQAQEDFVRTRRELEKAKRLEARKLAGARAKGILKDAGSRAAASANIEAQKEAKRIRERERMRAKRAAARALKETSNPSKR